MQHPPHEILVPFQVLAELKLGAAKSARPDHHALQVNHILRPFSIVWPDMTAVDHYVEVRHTLETTGTIISQPDLWIAAITRAAGGILVTNHTDEFSHVPGLMLEDWLKSRIKKEGESEDPAMTKSTPSRIDSVSSFHSYPDFTLSRAQ